VFEADAGTQWEATRRIDGIGRDGSDDGDGALLDIRRAAVFRAAGAIAAEEEEPTGKYGCRNGRRRARNRRGWRDGAPANGARRGWRGAAGA